MRRGVALTTALVTVLALAAPAWAADERDQIGMVDPATGLWYLRDSDGRVATFYYGNPGDFPILGDWDCDGDETPGMYRQSDGFVYLRNSNTQGVADIRFFFGNPGDVPIVGDFNGNLCDTVSIYRPSEGRVFIMNELGENDGGLGAADFAYYFGNPGDKPFVGDFDNDGTDTIGLHRESSGFVYLRNSHTQGVADNSFFFGNPGDRFVAGDWTADGTDTPGISRPSNTTWYFRYTNTQGNADESLIWGAKGWLPVAGQFGELTFPPAPRSTADRPDPSQTVQIHMMYVLPSDGVDREFDIDGTIEASVAALQRWLIDQTGGSGLRFDTFNGRPDITFYRLSLTDAELADRDPFIRDVIESELGKAGLLTPGKLFGVYYDGSSRHSCGGGAWPPLIVGQVAALYLLGEPPGAPACWTNSFAGVGGAPGYFEFAMLHEIVHTLGLVAACAPHHHLNGHVFDSPRDLMWSGDAPWEIWRMELDVGRDDYLGHDFEGCPDLADDPFLTPTPAVWGELLLNP